MIARRSILAGVAALPLLLNSAWPARAAAGPAATLDAFYATLLSVMKHGRKLGFEGRRRLLAPAVKRAFNMPLMTRLIVGLDWPSLSPTQQRELIAAFTDYSIATYASQFDDYSGERFVVDPKPAPAPDNDVMVKTKLIQSNGQPVQLNYLLRRGQDRWRIIDVYLSGTISQLAERRSEFSAVLRDRGVAGLIATLRAKAKSLATGNG